MSYLSTLTRNPGTYAFSLSGPTSSAARSLGQRRSTGADDAGGPDASDVAVLSKFSLSSHRLAATLPAQDASANPRSPTGALKYATGLLSRIGELKSRFDDPTASETDRATYQSEFAQLQAKLASLGLNLPAKTSSAGTRPSPLAIGAPSTALADPTPAEAPTGPLEFTDDFTTADNWDSTSGSLSVSDHTLYPNDTGGFGAIRSKQSFRGAMAVNFDVYLPGTNDSLDVSLGGTKLSRLTDGTNIAEGGWHSVQISYDGAGSAATYLDGSTLAADTQSGLDPASGRLGLANVGEGSARIRGLSVVITPSLPSAGDPTVPSSSDPASDGTFSATDNTDATSAVGTATLAAADSPPGTVDTPPPSVTDASDLASLDAATIADALDQIGTESAATTSNPMTASPSTRPISEAAAAIADAADAGQNTQLARQTMLFDSGTALAAQANLPQQSALHLLAA